MKREKELQGIARKYDLQIVYAFGSRGKEASAFIAGKIRRLPASLSDLDVAVKALRRLNIDEKVGISLSLEELFGVARVDLIVLNEVSAFVALEGVTGELLFAVDETLEANYQLYIMRRAAELLPYQRARIKSVLGATA
jgi:predicted nucleotidyltransferase